MNSHRINCMQSKMMKPQKLIKKTNPKKPIKIKQKLIKLISVSEMYKKWKKNTHTHTRTKNQTHNNSKIQHFRDQNRQIKQKKKPNRKPHLHSAFGINQHTKLGLESRIRVSTLTKLVGLPQKQEREPTESTKGTSFGCLTITI